MKQCILFETSSQSLTRASYLFSLTILFSFCFRVVIPLCGGNIDSTVLGRCIDRGLAADGRLCRFIVTVSDRPGGIAELTRLLASLGAR